MLRLLHAVVKIAIAALVVGTILAHFGITIETVAAEIGVSPGRVGEFMRQGIAWAAPNLALGLVVIVPVWLLSTSFVHAARAATERSPGDRPFPSLRSERPDDQRVAACRRSAPRVSIEAAVTTTVMTAMKIVHTALISGFTPSRTSE